MAENSEHGGGQKIFAQILSGIIPAGVLAIATIAWGSLAELKMVSLRIAEITEKIEHFSSKMIKMEYESLSMAAKVQDLERTNQIQQYKIDKIEETLGQDKNGR